VARLWAGVQLVDQLMGAELGQIVADDDDLGRNFERQPQRSHPV
jgi:hypothetical protein